ncbi:MAG: carbon-nitrogen hydrolase, partial [Sphingobacterium sp.]
MDIQVRNLTKKDYVGLKKSMEQAYDGVGETWSKENIQDLIEIFPEGQLCVEIDGQVVACALSIILNSKKNNIYDSYYDIIDDGKFSKHSNDGDTLYGIEV